MVRDLKIWIPISMMFELNIIDLTPTFSGVHFSEELLKIAEIEAWHTLCFSVVSFCYTLLSKHG